MKICRIASLFCVLALKLAGQADDYTLINQTLDQGGGVTQSTDYELIGSLTIEPSSPIVINSTDYTIYSGFIGQLINTPPKPVADVAALGADGTVTVDVLLNDTDDEYQALTVIGAGPSTGGTVSVINGRRVRFVAGSNFTGLETISYTVQDGDGASAVSTLTVMDTTAPVVASHADVTVEMTSGAGAVVTYAAGSAMDAAGVTSLTYSQNSGTVFPIGATTVTITARDAANNLGTGTFTVTVVAPAIYTLFQAAESGLL
ncbi:MAG: HYR domain-containing protein, partial [Pseudomonadota bacterium]